MSWTNSPKTSVSHGPTASPVSSSKTRASSRRRARGCRHSSGGARRSRVRTLPFPARNVRALSELVVDVGTVDPDFRFPQGLPSLELKLRDEFFGVGSLTGLQRLSIGVFNSAPLDLSGLTGLTWLNPNTSPVSRLPTSLVGCVLRVRCDTDLSPLTRLTALTLTMASGVHVTFPTQLKKLYLVDGRLDNSNIGDVALETFKSGCSRRITREDLERLPKTIRKIRGEFDPDSLRDHLGEFFFR